MLTGLFTTSVQSLRPQLNGNEMKKNLILCSFIIIALTGVNANERYFDYILNSPDYFQADDSLYPMVKKQTYHIVLAFPYELGQIFNEDYRQSTFSRTSLDFYQGMICAAENFNNHSLPFKLNIHVVDIPAEDKLTEANISAIRQYEPDLIICHLSNYNSDDFLKLSTSLKSTLISPFYADENQLQNNPWFITLKSSEKITKSIISKFIYKNYSSKNLILLCHSTPQLDEFTMIIKKSGTVSKLKNFSGYVVNASNWSSTEYTTLLEDSNLIVTDIQNDMVAINSILSNLTRQNGNHSQLMAPYSWLNYPAVDLNFLDLLNTIFYTEPVINYSDSTNADFILTYREKFNAEPGEFSFRGFKTLTYLIHSLEQKGKYIQRNSSNEMIPLIKDAGDKGFQNNRLDFYQINEHQLIWIGSEKD